MIPDHTLQELRGAWRSIYPADKSHKGICCPLCSSGSGPQGTGITEDPRRPGQLHCWACGFSGDILDLVQADPGVPVAVSFPTAVTYVGTLAGIDTGSGPLNTTQMAQNASSGTRAVSAGKRGGRQISSLEASESLSEDAGEDGLTNPRVQTYLAARGVSVSTARMLDARYDPSWRHPNAPASVPGTPRLVIPTADGSAVTRDIRPAESISPEQSRYVKQNVGPSRLLNAAALGQALPVFVVEGVFDALAVIEAGGQALALNSTANAPQLISAVQKADHVPPLILALDNDDAGRTAQARLTAALAAAGACVTAADLTGGAGDPNDALVADRAAFTERVSAAMSAAAAQAAAAEIAALVPMTMTAEEFFTAVDTMPALISTGIRSVDAALGGGLTPFGITVLGGRTGTGKTSLALQIVCSVIAGGRPVLYVPLEMSALQLTAKNLVRMAAIASPEAGPSCSAIDLLTGHMPASMRPIADAYFAATAPMLYVMPMTSEDTAGTVIERATQIKRARGTAPLVIIDYIQIMPVTDPRLQERQAINQNVNALKDAADSIPFFVISSFNRASYAAGKEAARGSDRDAAMLDMLEGAFKESGTLEYTGGALLGLWVPEGARAFREQIDLDLYVIKNRWGQRISRPVGLTLIGPSGEFRERRDEEGASDDELPPEWQDAPEW